MTTCFCVHVPAMGVAGLWSYCLHKQSRLCGNAAVKQTAKQRQTFSVLSKNKVVKDMKEHNKMKERQEMEINHFAWSYLTAVFILLFLGHVLAVLI